MFSKKLLVVDDEADFAEFVMDVAEGLGFDVSTTSDPATFAQYYSNEIDIIVLDLFMPVIDGIELLRFLVANNSRASIVFMSGKDKAVLHSAQELATEQGIFVLGALQKPFFAQELEEILSKDIPSSLWQSSNFIDLPSLDELREAIANGQLSLVYQPQINISNRKVTGVETLIRWHHPIKGLIPPSYFINLAEQHNLISAITDFVTLAAIRQLANWQTSGIELRMSINISPQTLVELDLPEKLANYAAEMGVNPANIVIEVTETAIMSDIVSFIDILTRMRMKGFNLSIDDFGTGYSSLQQLVRIPFTELKIDLAFILKLATDKECRTITEISILLAHKLDMRVVAEGIENEAVWNILKELGCDEGQGFWMGQPMPAEQLTGWLQNWSLN